MLKYLDTGQNKYTETFSNFKNKQTFLFIEQKYENKKIRGKLKRDCTPTPQK